MREPRRQAGAALRQTDRCREERLELLPCSCGSSNQTAAGVGFTSSCEGRLSHEVSPTECSIPLKELAWSPRVLEPPLDTTNVKRVCDFGEDPRVVVKRPCVGGRRVKVARW
jgi:hypothetical protein